MLNDGFDFLQTGIYAFCAFFFGSFEGSSVCAELVKELEGFGKRGIDSSFVLGQLFGGRRGNDRVYIALDPRSAPKIHW